MLTFPIFLRKPLQAGYSINQPAGYLASQPASGAYFAQIVTEDRPAYFNVQFLFTRGEAMAFQAWLRLNDFEIQNGAQFEIDLSTDDGITTQVGSFTPTGYPQRASESGRTVSYTAEIVVPRMNIPSLGFEDLVLGAQELGGPSILDLIVNEELPGA